MSIKYFPDRVYNGQAPAIDRVMAKRKPQLVRITANTVSNAFSETISANTDWIMDSVKLTFTTASQKNYSVKILSGVKVITNMNDYLRISGINALGFRGLQKITLSPGFYNGDDLATELETQLNANTEFISIGMTFTVAYDATTGLFTITPNAGQIQYIQRYAKFVPADKDSIAGHLFGLTQDSTMGATIVSDTPVFALDSVASIIDETTSVATSHYNDDIHTLSIDQAVQINSNVSPTVITAEICYEEII